MYFPYFRGRQYELLALKELATNDLLGKSVIPVVEPVKFSPTFNGTLNVFNDSQHPVALLLNPTVGDLVNDPSAIDSLLSVVKNNTNCIPTVLFNQKAESVIDTIRLSEIPQEDILTILNNRDFINTYRKFFASGSPRYTLIPDERQIKRTVTQNKVLFEDKFNKQDRNADYPEEEFFSEDHLFYTEEGYAGFGDYSIIGDEYIESGFAPYAVAIHIVYFADDDTLRICHFISDSNEDISDVAGKFYEAVSKLSEWFRNGQQRQQTVALNTLVEYADSGYYPGLPTIKKLSIMHHLELLGKFLDGGLRR